MSALDELLADGGERSLLVEPLDRGMPWPMLASSVVRREWAILRSRLRRESTVVRLPVASRDGGLVGRLSAGARAGALVVDDLGATTFGAIARAAGVMVGGGVVVGSSGGVIARRTRDGVAVIVRIGTGASDPLHAYEALCRFEHLSQVPSPLGSGRVEHWQWTVERRLSGRRPDTVSAHLLDQAVDLLATWPIDPTPPSFDDDAAVIAMAVPGTAPMVEDVVAGLRERVVRLPSTVRHGDLWHGNLLVDAGRITGIVDWDGWRASAFPGTDLLHLAGTAERRSRKMSFGTFWSGEPWNRAPAEPALRRLLDRLGIDGDAHVLRDMGIAWWLGQVSGDLHRNPLLAHQEAWVRQNVIEPLDLLRHR